MNGVPSRATKLKAATVGISDVRESGTKRAQRSDGELDPAFANHRRGQIAECGRAHGQTILQQLGQIVAAKVEGETDQRRELVVGKRQAEAVNCRLGYRQILLQESFGQLLRNGLALRHALRMTIAYRPHAHTVLVW